MSTDQNIREWARGQGIDVKDSGPIPAAIRNRYIDGQETDGRIEERAPQEVPTTPIAQARERVRRRFWDRGKTDRMLVQKPKGPPKARVSIDRLIQRIWGALSDVAKPINPPVSRVLMMQSPVAGLLLEEAARNTALDRMLQPLARGGQHFELAHALIGPPLFVAMLTTRPQMAPLIVPMLKDALRTWVDVAGPQIEKAAKREAEYMQKYGGKIDEMIEFILGDMIGEEPGDGTVSQ